MRGVRKKEQEIRSRKRRRRHGNRKAGTFGFLEPEMLFELSLFLNFS